MAKEPNPNDPINFDFGVVARQLRRARKKLKKSQPDVNSLASSIEGIAYEDTIEGSSTLTVTIADPEAEHLKFFDIDKDGKLDRIDVQYPEDTSQWWRMTQLSATTDPGYLQLTLTFMERPAVLLQKMHGPEKRSRGKVTRAEFFKSLVKKCEKETNHTLHFYSYELHKVQPIIGTGRVPFPGDGGDSVSGSIQGSPVPGMSVQPLDHDTDGLDGYPAADYMADPGTACVAPVDGKVTRLSGHPVSVALCPSGGPCGRSIYMSGDNGKDYYLTHLDHVSVKEGERVNQGAKMAVVADGPPSWSLPHVHMGVKSGVRSAVNSPNDTLADMEKRLSAMDPPGIGGAMPPADPPTAQPAPNDHAPNDEPHDPQDRDRPGHRRPGERNPNPGISPDFDGTIKGIKATDKQIRQIERALGVAARINAPDKATRAMLVAGIGESSFKPVMNYGGSGYGGVFQGDVSAGSNNYVWANNWHDTEAMAKSFLQGGKGFQGGGAIAMVKGTGTYGEQTKSWTIGHIAWKVEASDESAGFYDAYASEADAIMEAWGGGYRGGPTYVRTQFNFEIGTANQPHENYWDGMTRLAEDVRWRLFINGNTIYFDDDMTLIRAKPVLTIHRDSGRLLRWNATWDARKMATEMIADVISEPFEFRAGDVFFLKEFGPLSKGSSAHPPRPGHWLATEITRDSENVYSTITLRQPQRPYREPPTETRERTEREENNERGAPTRGAGANIAPSVEVSAAATSGGGAYGAPRDYPGGHAGIDVSMPDRTKLFAITDGVIKYVSHSWYDSSNGKGTGCVGLVSTKSCFGLPAGTAFIYGHSDEHFVRVGTRVKAGEKICLSGSPGGGAHLHFAINLAGVPSGNGDTNPTSVTKRSLGID